MNYYDKIEMKYGIEILTIIQDERAKAKEEVFAEIIAKIHFQFDLIEEYYKDEIKIGHTYKIDAPEYLPVPGEERGTRTQGIFCHARQRITSPSRYSPSFNTV